MRVNFSLLVGLVLGVVAVAAPVANPEADAAALPPGHPMSPGPPDGFDERRSVALSERAAAGPEGLGSGSPWYYRWVKEGKRNAARDSIRPPKPPKGGTWFAPWHKDEESRSTIPPPKPPPRPPTIGTWFAPWRIEPTRDTTAVKPPGSPWFARWFKKERRESEAAKLPGGGTSPWFAPWIRPKPPLPSLPILDE